jgi:hypothetical protein
VRSRASPGVALGALLVVVIVVLVVAGCGNPASTTPPPSASLPPLVSPVTGVLTHIEAEALSKVTAFTLRTADGRETRFQVGILDNGDQFPPGHLAEHMANASPVKVWFRDDGSGNLVVYRLEDG